MKKALDLNRLTALEFARVIKPCPFCGSKVIAMYEFGVVPDPHIRCEGCQAQTDEHKSREMAIKAWNRRDGKEWKP